MKGPDSFGPHDHRPYVCLGDDSHPFSGEEARYAAMTTTRRSVAIPLGDDDSTPGGLTEESYVNPWTITSIRHADVQVREGRLENDVVDAISKEAAGYLGAQG